MSLCIEPRPMGRKGCGCSSFLKGHEGLGYLLAESKRASFRAVGLTLQVRPLLLGYMLYSITKESTTEARTLRTHTKHTIGMSNCRQNQMWPLSQTRRLKRTKNTSQRRIISQHKKNAKRSVSAHVFVMLRHSCFEPLVHGELHRPLAAKHQRRHRPLVERQRPLLASNRSQRICV